MTREQKDRILERNRLRARLRAPFQKVLGEGKHLHYIHYQKEPKFRVPEEKVFRLKDYEFLFCLEADDLDQIFSYLQGERWSPLGEARELITELGLCHTSMSTGDLIQNQWFDGKEGKWMEKWLMVDSVGFTEVKRKGWI